MLAQAGLVTLFNTIGVATQHEHWQKEAEDVEPIVGPLCRIIETLPASTLKAFEKRFNTVALVGGIAFVAVPDITAEIKLRAIEADAKKGQTLTSRGSQPARPHNAQGQAPGGPGGVYRTMAVEPPNGAAVPDDTWRETLPPPGLHVDY